MRDCYSVQTRNEDWRRFGSGRQARVRRRIKDLVALCCRRFGLVPCRYDADRLSFILDHLGSFTGFFHLLGDEYSRDLMVKVLEFKVLGPRHVKLPLNTDDFWEKYDTVDQKCARKLKTECVWNGRFFLNLYEIHLENAVLTMHGHQLTTLNTFLLEQYAYRQNGLSIAVEEGDVVVDGGGCYGDTALYFAAKSGNSGSVLSFEFLEENLGIFRKNLAQNPDLAKRVRLLTKALWDRSGETLSFDGDGPGTRVYSKTNGHAATGVESVSIDELVLIEKLPKVDFIKLDIEGSELEALKGACETIKRFKPNLAVSLYHKMEDFITIPQWIESLGVGYRFYLDHFTIHHEETILFATAR
jgi:FkbM family methyltransferase